MKKIDNAYKTPFHARKMDKNNYCFQFIDQSLESDIINYEFRPMHKGKEIRGSRFTISMAIKSLRNELEKECMKKELDDDHKSFQKTDKIGSISSILNDKTPPILISLENIFYFMNTAENRFGTNNSLSDFPYAELCYIISNMDDVRIIIGAIECLRMALKFDFDFDSDVDDLIKSKITEDAINSLENFMKSENTDLNKATINIISIINQLSENLCNQFCAAGLATALAPYVPHNLATFAIQSSMKKCSDEFSLKFLFLLFQAVTSTDDELIALHFFSGIDIFTCRFGFDSIPDQLSDEEIDPGTIFECKNIIFVLLDHILSTSKRFDLISNLMKFCNKIPEENPPNILQYISEYITDDSFFVDDETHLIENISGVLIHFYNSWKDYIPRDFFINLYDLIKDSKVDFQISFAYAKIIVTYHQVELDQFDLNVVELCTRYICCSDVPFSHMCILLIYKIIRMIKISKPDEMLEYIQILRDAQENLHTHLEDPDLNPDFEEIIRKILDEIEENKDEY